MGQPVTIGYFQWQVRKQLKTAINAEMNTERQMIYLINSVSWEGQAAYREFCTYKY
jgi:hypothetical protein